MQDLTSIQKAYEQYYSLSNYAYPNSLPSVLVATTGSTLMEMVPTDPKGIGYTFTALTGGYCLCGYVEGKSGNSLNSSCVFSGVGSTGDYFCVKNQQ
jgi:hypothetical protein